MYRRPVEAANFILELETAIEAQAVGQIRGGSHGPPQNAGEDVVDGSPENIIVWREGRRDGGCGGRRQGRCHVVWYTLLIVD